MVRPQRAFKVEELGLQTGCPSGSGEAQQRLGSPREGAKQAQKTVAFPAGLLQASASPRKTLIWPLGLLRTWARACLRRCVVVTVHASCPELVAETAVGSKGCHVAQVSTCQSGRKGSTQLSLQQGLQSTQGSHRWRNEGLASAPAHRTHAHAATLVVQSWLMVLNCTELETITRVS